MLHDFVLRIYLGSLYIGWLSFELAADEALQLKKEVVENGEYQEDQDCRGSETANDTEGQ